LQKARQNLLARLISPDEIRVLRYLQGGVNEDPEILRIIDEAERRVLHAEKQQAELAARLIRTESSLKLELDAEKASRLSLEAQLRAASSEIESQGRSIEKLSKKANQLPELKSQLQASLKEVKALRGDRNRLVVELEGVKSRLAKTSDKKWGGAAIARRTQSQLQAEIVRLNNELSLLKGGIAIEPTSQNDSDEKGSMLPASARYLAQRAIESSFDPVYHSGLEDEDDSELKAQFQVLFCGSTADQERALPLLSRVRRVLGESARLSLVDLPDTDVDPPQVEPEEDSSA